MTSYLQGLPEQEEGGEEEKREEIRREEEKRGWGLRRECTAALPCGLPFFCRYGERFPQNGCCFEQRKERWRMRDKGKMLMARRHTKNVKVKCVLCL